MSLKTETASLVVFPKQQQILDYINNHPIQSSIDTPVVKSTAPDSLQKVAKYFSEKKMELSEIKGHVKIAITQEDEDYAKLKKLQDALAKFILKCEEIDEKSVVKEPTADNQDKPARILDSELDAPQKNEDQESIIKPPRFPLSSKDSSFTMGMKDAYSHAELNDQYVALIVTIYDSVLRDLLEGATYTPPKDDPNGTWARSISTRNVSDLTTQQDLSSNDQV